MNLYCDKVNNANYIVLGLQRLPPNLLLSLPSICLSLCLVTPVFPPLFSLLLCVCEKCCKAESVGLACSSKFLQKFKFRSKQGESFLLLVSLPSEGSRLSFFLFGVVGPQCKLTEGTSILSSFLSELVVSSLSVQGFFVPFG